VQALSRWLTCCRFAESSRRSLAAATCRHTQVSAHVREREGANVDVYNRDGEEPVRVVATQKVCVRTVLLCCGQAAVVSRGTPPQRVKRSLFSSTTRRRKAPRSRRGTRCVSRRLLQAAMPGVRPRSAEPRRIGCFVGGRRNGVTNAQFPVPRAVQRR